MKKTFFFLLAVLMTAGCTRAHIRQHVQEPARSDAEETVEPQTKEAAPISQPMESIPIGEHLEYEISWWGVPVGNATLRTSKGPGRDITQLNFEAQSNWYLRTFYPVTARLTSLVDSETGAPQRFQSYVKRHWREHQSVITFDSDEKNAFHQLPQGKTATVAITPETQDGLSMIYRARMMPMELGKTMPLEIAADGKNWELNARVVQAGIVQIGNLGDWPALEGRVELAYPVPFFHGARARVWLSADKERIPLLAKIRSRIGPVTVVLKRRTVPNSNPKI